MSILAGEPAIAATDESIEAVDNFMWGFPDQEEGYIPNPIVAWVMTEMGWDG